MKFTSDGASFPACGNPKPYPVGVSTSRCSASA